METLKSTPAPEEKWHLPEYARPEVEGPNSAPTNGRIETSSENYAADGPPVPVSSDSVRRAAQRKRKSDILTYESMPTGPQRVVEKEE